MTCKIGEMIRTLRQNRKMTQEQLADRLGVSYQSVSRWENGVTYPDIEFLPAIAKHFSVSLDYLLGQDDAEKKKQIRKRISGIAKMTESDSAELIDLIRTCRREQDGEYFEGICYSLRYSPLWQNTEVIGELRKSGEMFFETCSDAAIRSGALGYYACLEEERHVKSLLDRYASDRTTGVDHLLKERYLFRDELDKFDSARQRCFHKDIAYMIDGDISLWRDSSKPMDAEYTLFENGTKLALLHSLCRETPTDECPITCGNPPDIFAEQRIYIGMRQVCALVATGDKEKAYAALRDIVSLMESVMSMPDGAELCCTSPALDSLRLCVRDDGDCGEMGRGKSLYYTLEDGETELFERIFPKGELECLTSASYARWGWLDEIRGEEEFTDLVARLEKIS